MPKLFCTSGVRGSAEKLFTKQFCIRLGLTYGQWLIDQKKQGFVAVAMDPRDSSPFIKEHLITGLASMGWEILDQGAIPTPALTYYLKQTAKLAGALMITGSHISAGLNGVKFLIDGEEVDKSDELEIEKIFSEFSGLPPKNTPVVVNDSSASEMYIDLLVNLIPKFDRKLKIVIDTANGTQTEIMRNVFDRLKADVAFVGDADIQSSTFIPRDTESQGAFTDLGKEVIRQRADVGMGFDIDGDRAIFVDEHGEFIHGDYSCSLIAKYSAGESIVTPISTASVVDSLGKKVYRTKVGSTNVVTEMKRTGSTLGFESNGGFISSEIFYGRDGGTTAMKLLQIMSSEKKSLSSLIHQLPELYLFKDKLDCPFLAYPHIYDAVKEKYAGKKIEEIDGLKIWLSDDEFILFRGSGNAPEFRIFTQAKSKVRAQVLGQGGLDFVRGVINDTSNIQSAGFQDTLGIYDSILSFPDQFSQVISEFSQMTVPAACGLVDNIVVTGMGGSALGGRILASLEREYLKVPLVVSTEYQLPNFVGKKTLVVASSYSGNTAETLAALEEAQKRQAQIFVLASGGKLAQIARELKLPNYIFDPKYNPSSQPRMGLGYNVMATAGLLSRCHLISEIADLQELAPFLRSSQTEFKKLATLATQIVDKIPVFVASEHLKGAAYDLRNQFNENAKSFAVWCDLPEAHHHLMEGLSFPKNNPQNLIFVFLKSCFYHPEILKRYPITAEILGKQKISYIDFPMFGKNQFFETMQTIQSGALLAYELAKLNGIDPGPIPWVNYLKDKTA